MQTLKDTAMENAKEEKKTVFNILTNRTDGWDTDEVYADYVENCEINGIEPAEKGSSEYWEWVYEEIEESISCDLDNMQYSKIKDRVFAITGKVGLWWGTPTIKTKCVRGLVETVKAVWGDGDRHFNIELDTEKGIITARLWSHDDPCGNTQFEVRMLNRNGEKWLAAAEERGEEDEIEINNRWWSKITDIGMIY